MFRSNSGGLWALYVVTFVSHLGWTVLSPVLPLIQSQFGLTAAAVSLVSSVYGISRLVTSLPTGFLADRIGHRKLLQIGCATLVVGSVVGALAPDFETLLLSRLISGVGSCLMVVTNIVLVSHLSPVESRGRSMGIYQAASQAGTAISPALAGILAEWGGWQAPLWLSAGTAFMGLLLIMLLPDLGRTVGSEVHERSRTKAGAEGSGHWPSVAAAQFVTFSLFFAGSTFASTFVPLFGKQVLGLGSLTLGLILGGGTFLRFLTSIGGGHLSDRFGRRTLILIGQVLTAGGMFVVTRSAGIPVFLAGMALLSFGRFGNGVPNSVLADHLPRSQWGRAMGFNRFLGDLGLVLGPAMVGVLLDRSGTYAAGMALATAVVLAGAGALMIRETVAGQKAETRASS